MGAYTAVSSLPGSKLAAAPGAPNDGAATAKCNDVPNGHSVVTEDS